MSRVVTWIHLNLFCEVVSWNWQHFFIPFQFLLLYLVTGISSSFKKFVRLVSFHICWIQQKLRSFWLLGCTNYHDFSHPKLHVMSDNFRYAFIEEIINNGFSEDGKSISDFWWLKHLVTGLTWDVNMVKKCDFHLHTQETFSSWGCFMVRDDYENVFCWESHSQIFLNILCPNRLQTYYWNHVMKMKMLMEKIIVKGLCFSVVIQTYMINLQLFFVISPIFWARETEE